MRRFAVYLVTAVILILFVLFMNAGNYLKSPQGTSDDVALYFELLDEDIRNEQWQIAEDNTKSLNRAWKEVVPRIQFSVEKDEINAVNVNLARLDAYVSARDKSNALAELSESLEHWKNLNR